MLTWKYKSSRVGHCDAVAAGLVEAIQHLRINRLNIPWIDLSHHGLHCIPKVGKIKCFSVLFFIFRSTQCIPTYRWLLYKVDLFPKFESFGSFWSLPRKTWSLLRTNSRLRLWLHILHSFSYLTWFFKGNTPKWVELELN